MECMEKIVDLLSQKSAMIRALEDDAQAALYGRSDKLAYQAILREKSLLLYNLLDEIDRLSCEIGTEVCKEIKNRIGGISFSAGKALRLNSVFYMSCLLYPENYQDGDRNDLEQVIDFLKAAL